MAKMGLFQSVPLPKSWPKHAKTAFLSAVSLAHRAAVITNSWCVNSRIARVRLIAENQQLKTEVAMLREEMRIKDSRMAHILPENRPHYPPVERLAILALKASRGWNKAQAARAFIVTPETITRWLNRLEDDGADALVASPCPVNRFPDFVISLLQQLKSVCPSMGKQRIADTLARAGLHLSPSTAARLLKKTVPSKKPPPDADRACSSTGGTAAPSVAANAKQPSKPKRVMTAKYPGHVWHVDLTAVPTCLGFWIPWFPHTWAQCWPFCFWIAVVVDHFSRKAVMVRCFRSNPSAQQVTDTLDIAIAAERATPKYIISDKGSQFREEYLDWCHARGVKPRFGAIGRHGSIAVVERFIRTIKQECVRRIVVPLATATFEQELLTYVRWYNEHRPHRTLHGKTPNEIHDARSPASERPCIETRDRPTGESPSTAASHKVAGLRLIVMHFEDRKHLPVIELARAA